jgi:hypothetical protein
MNKILILFFVGCLAVIASIFWFCSLPVGIPLTTEAKFRLSGMVLQVYGIGAVALKLSEAHRQVVRSLHLYVGVVAVVIGVIAQGASTEIAQYVTRGARSGGVWPWCGA